MEQRTLGRSGLQVPKLAFGGNVFGWTVDRPTSFSILDALLDNGLNFIDTADEYSHWAVGNQGGESETLIGEWLKKSGNRDRIILATKVGMPMGTGAIIACKRAGGREEAEIRFQCILAVEGLAGGGHAGEKDFRAIMGR